MGLGQEQDIGKSVLPVKVALRKLLGSGMQKRLRRLMKKK